MSFTCIRMIGRTPWSVYDMTDSLPVIERTKTFRIINLRSVYKILHCKISFMFKLIGCPHFKFILFRKTEDKEYKQIVLVIYYLKADFVDILMIIEIGVRLSNWSGSLSCSCMGKLKGIGRGMQCWRRLLV